MIFNKACNKQETNVLKFENLFVFQEFYLSIIFKQKLVPDTVFCSKPHFQTWSS